MARKVPKPEEIFYDSVKKNIENMFTDANPNFKSYHYASTLSPFEFQRKVTELAQHVLSNMEKWKHLIELPVPKIVWETQDKYYGLDYRTASGKWQNYSFDIRYDYDGPADKKPSCGCFALINRTQNPGNGKAAGWEPTVKIEDKFGKTPEELMGYCQQWLEDEYNKFLNG